MLNDGICLLNDSFPPIIDGVANSVLNYARVIRQSGGSVFVVTPECPGSNDDALDYPVIRYPGIDLSSKIGYVAGNPFDVPTLISLREKNIGLLHSHCPFMSNMIARTLRKSMRVPFIMTYHTNFEFDFANLIKQKAVRAGAIRALVDSVCACDELWAVSDGAGRNLQKLGYQGDYIVMENGVDMPRGRMSDDAVVALVYDYNLPASVPVFLFVGRLMWYKGLRIILDALAALKSQAIDFRMVFVGGGLDEPEVKQYTKDLNLGDKVLFTGKLHDRNMLTAWYSRADLLLFPSTYDTNGLVVREAAACSLASVLIAGSCAAEGVHHEVDGLLIEENAASLAVCLMKIMNDRVGMRNLGENASKNLYISWDDAVGKAIQRYGLVMERYNSNYYAKSRRLSDSLFAISGEMLDLLAVADEYRKTLGELL